MAFCFLSALLTMWPYDPSHEEDYNAFIMKI